MIGQWGINLHSVCVFEWRYHGSWEWPISCHVTLCDILVVHETSCNMIWHYDVHVMISFNMLQHSDS